MKLFIYLLNYLIKPKPKQIIPGVILNDKDEIVNRITTDTIED